jgi:ribulose-phosphate 3-epimerase
MNPIFLINFFCPEKTMMKLIAPSILSADFSHLAEDVQKVIDAGADWIHADVMDGHFVPNITFGPMVVAAVRSITDLPIDVHLMIEAPERYIEAFAKAGASHISVQVETCVHLHRTIAQIKETGAKAGAVLNPATPLSAVNWILSDVDYVLVMSVNPGFGGQTFIPSSLDKIRALRQLIDTQELDVQIEIDGGVNRDTIGAIAAAGADVFVAGSAIFGSDDYQKTIAAFREIIDRPNMS